jgi:FdhD protein
MSADRAIRPFEITTLDGALGVERDDLLAVEEPLEIRVDGRSVAVVMRTPGHDRELAAGFLVTEGILHSCDEVLDMVYCRMRSEEAAGDEVQAGPRENVLDVLLAPGVAVDWARLTRNVFTSSSCGVCSKASIEAVRAVCPPLVVSAAPSRAMIAALPEQLRAAQTGFAATGGLHASALVDAAGKVRAVREDVGRHNALDKIIGNAFFANTLPLSGCVLGLSGRVSFEIMQKALLAGIPCVAAVSAPTSAAVEFARASGQTLVGFVRGARMNIYAGTLSG